MLQQQDTGVYSEYMHAMQGASRGSVTPPSDLLGLGSSSVAIVPGWRLFLLQVGKDKSKMKRCSCKQPGSSPVS